jgi:hypothetical protein
MCRRLLADQPLHVEVDLSDVTAMTTEGIDAIRACVFRGSQQSCIVDVIVGSSEGRAALLSSMANV